MQVADLDPSLLLDSVLVIGAKNSGKTSFLQFLRQSLAHKKRHGMAPAEQQNHHNGDTPPQTSAGPLNPNATFTSQYLETEIDGERIGLTLWDSEGLEKNVVDLQLRELSSFLESKFEETFTEEQKVVRATGIQDTHIHCVFLILDPGRLDKTISNFALRNELDKQPMLNGHKAGAPRPKGGLDPSFDLQVIRSLQGKTAVIPVIGKADTITTAHMGFLKRMVWGSLKDARLDPLEAFGLDDTDFNSGKLDERDEDDEIASTAADHQGENEAEEEDSGSDYSGVDPVFGPSTVAQQRDQTTKARKVSARTERQISAAAAAAELAAETSGELPYLPMSIISPDQYEPGNLGRRFPWGFADPFNAEHCDYLKLKEMVFSEWRAELRVASRERWYEDWRTSRLNRGR